MSFNFTSDLSDKLDGEIIQKLSNIFINNKLLDVIEFCSLDHCQISNLAANLCIDRKILKEIQTDVKCKLIPEPQNACELLLHMKEREHLYETGFEPLDKMMDGGLYSREVIEVLGRSGSGKTELCFYLTGYIVRNLEEPEVLFIDNDLSFDASRLVEIIETKENKKLDQDVKENLLNRIKCSSFFDCASFIDFLEKLSFELGDEDCQFNKVKLVVIDSLSTLLEAFDEEVNDAENIAKEQLEQVKKVQTDRKANIPEATLSQFVNKFELLESFEVPRELALARCRVDIQKHRKQQMFSQIAASLRCLAEKHFITVIVTNFSDCIRTTDIDNMSHISLELTENILSRQIKLKHSGLGLYEMAQKPLNFVICEGGISLV